MTDSDEEQEPPPRCKDTMDMFQKLRKEDEKIPIRRFSERNQHDNRKISDESKN